jgi:hypothetical protein
MRQLLTPDAPLGGGQSPALTTDSEPVEVTPKIRAFEQRLGGTLKSEDSWKRQPNIDGTGALHVRSFHCKLGGDALAYLDKQINDWLDAHPECEIKFATTAVGEWSGTVKEPHLIVQIWV